MLSTILITLNALVVILFSICFWQHLIIKGYRKDFDAVQENVWKLSENYLIPEEDIRACFLSTTN